MPGGGLSASQLPLQLELVGLDILATAAIVAFDADIDHFTWFKFVLGEAHLTTDFGGAKDFQANLAHNLELVVLGWDLLRLLTDVDPSTASEDRDLRVATR